jgi:hypothetical protein
MLKLRCHAYSDSRGWVAECVELGIAAYADGLDAVRLKLEVAIGNFIENLIRAEKRGEKPAVVRIPGYLKERLLWDVRYHLARLVSTPTRGTRWTESRRALGMGAQADSREGITCG